MARIADALPYGALVGIDTPAFIYALENHPTYAARVRRLFLELARGSFEGVTSVITLMEIAVRPLQLGLAQVADDYDAILSAYPHLEVRDVDRGIARLAAELRARHRLHPADSVQVATALDAGAAAFLTNDRALRRVREIRILLVGDFAEDAT
jgi:predicted nucleic acid-binding protein